MILFFWNKKKWYFVVCRKKTNNTWITHDTIHLCFLFFAQVTYCYILRQNYLGAQHTTLVRSMNYFIFSTFGCAACNYGMHSQLVTEYLLSCISWSIISVGQVTGLIPYLVECGVSILQYGDDSTLFFGPWSRTNPKYKTNFVYLRTTVWSKNDFSQ
jgi:hypothetical protein